MFASQDIHCSFPAETKEAYKKFKFQKVDTTTAMSLKIDKNAMTVVVDNTYSDPKYDDMVDDLDECNPRFILISYRHVQTDQYGGRVQYPLLLATPQMHMLYSRTKPLLPKEFAGVQRVVDIREKEELTEQLILDALKKK